MELVFTSVYESYAIGSLATGRTRFWTKRDTLALQGAG